MIRALCLVLALALPGEVWADSYIDPGFSLTPAESIEDMFAESDAVVVGRIEKFESGMTAYEGGNIWHRRLFITVEQVLKGDTKKKRIDLDPGNVEGLASGSFERWQDGRTHVLFFLTDLSVRGYERKHPNSAGGPWEHQWILLPTVPRYGVPAIEASSELIDVASYKELHSIESLAREADAVVLGTFETGSSPRLIHGQKVDCFQIQLQRVLKGTVAAGPLYAHGRGFGVFPYPRVAALYFLKRLDPRTYEILHLSAGVKPVRGDRLRQDNVSLDEAIARIQSAGR